MSRARRGNYALLLAVALVVVLGFGALALDIAYMLLGRAQTQDVADAASQAAMIALRQTGDEVLARRAAELIVDQNQVLGEPPEIDQIVFGSWDDSWAEPVFVPHARRPNAVHLSVARDGGEAASYLLARIWGYDHFDLLADATSASRSVQLVFVLDITGSWGEADFAQARAAVIGALDLLEATATSVDEVAMTIFTNRYAWAYTPFTNIADPDAAAAVRADWQQLNIASKAGRDANHHDGRDCVLNPASTANDFRTPPGGCYPDMPREYTDEAGTDHSTGILQAQELFQEHAGGANYRAMIVITDGRPNALGGSSGQLRAADHYVEDRWREYLGPVPRSQDAIRSASIAATGELWSALRVNTWVVSLVAYDPMMPAMVRGDGYDTLASSSSELARMVAQIISEMPLAIVE